MDTTFCPICLVQFHTRVRCVNHVRFRSQICRINLALKGPIICEVEANKLDECDRELNRDLARNGKKSCHASSPAVRLPGPLEALLVSQDTYSSHHPLGFGRNYNA